MNQFKERTNCLGEIMDWLRKIRKMLAELKGAADKKVLKIPEISGTNFQMIEKNVLRLTNCPFLCPSRSIDKGNFLNEIRFI